MNKQYAIVVLGWLAGLCMQFAVLSFMVTLVLVVSLAVLLVAGRDVAFEVMDQTRSFIGMFSLFGMVAGLAAIPLGIFHALMSERNADEDGPGI